MTAQMNDSRRVLSVMWAAIHLARAKARRSDGSGATAVGVGITDNKDKSFELIFTVPVGREGVAGWGGRVAE